MKVLITGATGLLGGHLLQELQQRGKQIRALVLPVENAEKLMAQGVEVVRGDVTDASTLAPAVKDREIVIHLSGMMGVDRPRADYRLVNVTGSENLYRAAQAAGVRRFVHTSSHTVYGLGYGRFLTEKDALRPDLDPYSSTKAEGDRLIRRLMLNGGMETVILRPGTFFGPGDRLHFGRIAQRMKYGKGVIIGRGDNALPFCYVTDVVQGFLLAAYHEKAPGNVYNISNDHPLTQQEIFNAVADDVDGKRPTRHLPYPPIYYGSIVAEKIAKITHTKPIVTPLGVMMFGTDNRHSVEKARSELGYEPKVEIREGIRLAASWFNAGGMDQPLVTQASQYAPLTGARKS
ncbi:MAG TPA: NAD-dependent epimerase/dehydratase family protein [Ktedonobacteraceae bacterium]|nr:NAD-dependent epimerase/dehydratase family protein [Ktedonobacteraceae bacterium]